MGMKDLNPEIHYDRVTPAWVLLMGENLHYGYFERGDEDLATATEALTRLMARHAQIEPGMAVLDVGCGTGRPACFLAEAHDCHVTGISTGEVGLETARERAEEKHLTDRLEFRYGDGTDNGLPDQSFDRVWVMQSSHFMRQKDRLISECARVLRPGGRLVLCDIVLRSIMPMAEVVKYRRELLLLQQVYGQAKMEPLEVYERLSRDNHLDVEITQDISRQTFPTFEHWRKNAAHHRDRLFELISREHVQQFVESCDVLEMFWNEQKLGYGLISAVKSD